LRLCAGRLTLGRLPAPDPPTMYRNMPNCGAKLSAGRGLVDLALGRTTVSAVWRGIPILMSLRKHKFAVRSNAIRNKLDHDFIQGGRLPSVPDLRISGQRWRGKMCRPISNTLSERFRAGATSPPPSRPHGRICMAKNGVTNWKTSRLSMPPIPHNKVFLDSLLAAAGAAIKLADRGSPLS